MWGAMGLRRAFAALLPGAALLLSTAAEAQSGPLDLRGEWTQFLAMAAAGSADEAPRYGGRLDGFARIDASQLGLWDGLSIHLHAELVYGRSVNRIGGRLLLPVNTALNFPANDETAFDLSYSVVQKLGPVRVQLGKINLLEQAAAIPIVGGGGKEGFQHLGLAAPPALLASPKVLGVIATAPVGPLTVNVGLWSPDDWTQEYGPDGLFEDGLNAMLLVTARSHIGGLAGFHNFTAYATSSRKLRSDNPEIRPPDGIVDLPLPGRSGAHFRYGLQQYLWQDPGDPRRGWGFFGHVGVSTGTPDVLDWSATAGFAGSPPLAGRPRDRFGLGYFRVSLANIVVDGLAPLVTLQDEQGAELFYTAEVSPRLRLTATAQLVDSLLRDADTAVFLGLRLKASLD